MDYARPNRMVMDGCPSSWDVDDWKLEVPAMTTDVLDQPEVRLGSWGMRLVVAEPRPLIPAWWKRGGAIKVTDDLGRCGEAYCLNVVYGETMTTASFAGIGQPPSPVELAGTTDGTDAKP